VEVDSGKDGHYIDQPSPVGPPCPGTRCNQQHGPDQGKYPIRDHQVFHPQTITPKGANPQTEVDQENPGSRRNDSKGPIFRTKPPGQPITTDTENAEQYAGGRWLLNAEKIGGVYITRAGAETG